MTLFNMKIPVYHVDAFTSVSFKGNAAGVCLLKEELEPEIMKAIAAELKLSETAFVYVDGNLGLGGEKLKLRWFSPECEMPLCGHATLATAKVLFEELGFKAASICFSTLSGDLIVKKSAEGMIMEFPLDEYVPMEVPVQLLTTLGIENIREAVIGKSTSKLVIVVDSVDEVVNLRPDFAAMKSFNTGKLCIKGVGVTAQGDSPYDFTSRYFNPWAGVDEDPVTGSVHTVLAGYWADRLGKKRLRALQASKRSGEIAIGLIGNNRVELAGDAVIVLKGEIYM